MDLYIPKTILIYLFKGIPIQCLVIMLLIKVELYILALAISFQENSTTVFKDNPANNDGGAVYSRYGYVCFEQNSFTSFRNNSAYDGAAVWSRYGYIYISKKIPLQHLIIILLMMMVELYTLKMLIFILKGILPQCLRITALRIMVDLYIL